MHKKKSLGQHFLHNAHYLRAVADAAQLAVGDTVLEIGPGDGALTGELLSRGVKVVAIEKDHRLIPLLKEKFAQEITKKKLKILEADVLEFNPSSHKLEAGNYKLVANIPYYITGAIIKKFLSDKTQPSDVVLLVQKEVAERIARSRKESILSLSVKAYGTPTYIKTVPKGAFSPPPAVDSAILGIYDISRKHFKTKKQEEQFFELLHAGFSQKRKLLKKNLLPLLGEYSGIFKNAGVKNTTRAEEVPLSQWIALSALY